MSLWGDYYQERVGGKVIETGLGFVAYRILPETKEVFIDELYVVPRLRKGHVATEFLADVAKDAKPQGCQFMTCSVQMAAHTKTEALLAALSHGFRVLSSDAERINLVKEI